MVFCGPKQCLKVSLNTCEFHFHSRFPVCLSLHPSVLGRRRHFGTQAAQEHIFNCSSEMKKAVEIVFKGRILTAW